MSKVELHFRLILPVYFRSTSSVAGLKFDHFSVIGRKDPEDISEQPYTTENLKYLKGGYKALSQSAKIMDINFNDPAVSIMFLIF